jgi:hypothetical protein
MRPGAHGAPTPPVVFASDGGMRITGARTGGTVPGPPREPGLRL